MYNNNEIIHIIMCDLSSVELRLDYIMRSYMHTCTHIILVIIILNVVLLSLFYILFESCILSFFFGWKGGGDGEVILANIDFRGFNHSMTDRLTGREIYIHRISLRMFHAYTHAQAHAHIRTRLGPIT